jgi:hypothetical protein
MDPYTGIFGLLKSRLKLMVILPNGICLGLSIFGALLRHVHSSEDLWGCVAIANALHSQIDLLSSVIRKKEQTVHAISSSGALLPVNMVHIIMNEKGYSMHLSASLSASLSYRVSKATFFPTTSFLSHSRAGNAPGSSTLSFAFDAILRDVQKVRN